MRWFNRKRSLCDCPSCAALRSLASWIDAPVGFWLTLGSSLAAVIMLVALCYHCWHASDAALAAAALGR